jgi:hypothetical protein
MRRAVSIDIGFARPAHASQTARHIVHLQDAVRTVDFDLAGLVSSLVGRLLSKQPMREADFRTAPTEMFQAEAAHLHIFQMTPRSR